MSKILSFEEEELFYLKGATARDSDFKSEDFLGVMEGTSDEETIVMKESQKPLQLHDVKDDEKLSPFKGGLEWYFEVLADDYIQIQHCLPSGELKPRRPLPQIRASEFFRAVVRRETEAGVLYIYEERLKNMSIFMAIFFG